MYIERAIKRLRDDTLIVINDHLTPIKRYGGWTDEIVNDNKIRKAVRAELDKRGVAYRK